MNSPKWLRYIGVRDNETEMKNIVKILLPVVFVHFGCKSDIEKNYSEYYRTYNEIKKLEKKGKIYEALKLFRNAEQQVDFVPVQHLLNARSLSEKIGECEIVQIYFQKAVNNGFEFEKYIYQPENCPEVQNNSIIKHEFDFEYKDSISNIYSVDQGIRNSSDKSLMRVIDSINIQKLMHLIDVKGYPSSKLVGHKSAANAFIVLLHYDSDIGNKKLEPILENAYNSGYISPENYAWIIDRRRSWGPDNLDPYYFQIPGKKYFELTKNEIDVIDQRRDSIGLRPLSEMGIKRTEDGGISITNSY